MSAATPESASAEPAEPAIAEPVCSARLKKGGRCTRRPTPGLVRCRQHGGHARMGPPKGNRNAVKHGASTAEEIALRRQVNEFIRECWRAIREIREMRRG